MFRNVPYIEEYIASLEVHKVLLDCDKDFKGNILFEDDFWVLADEKIREMCWNIHYFEEYDSTMYKFCFPELFVYYELCRKYCKKNNINFKKSSYVKKAQKDVYEMLYNSGADNIQWNLWIPKKIVKKRRYILMIETGCYFNERPQLLEVLYEIKDYYKQQGDEIKKLLEEKSKIIKIPSQEKEVKAA